MKKEVFEKWNKRSEEKAKRLLYNPVFQDDIKNLRKKWGIPIEGIKTNKKAEEFEMWLCNESDRWHKNEWPKYREELLKLKQNDYLQYEQRLKIVNGQNPLNAFKNDIKKLVKKNYLSPRWEDKVETYLRFNENLQAPMGLVVELKNSKDDSSLEEIVLHIEKDTTLQDIKDEWKSIEFFQNKLPYKTQKTFQSIDEKNLERGKRAYELKKGGRTLKEVAKILNEEFQIDCFWTDVSKYIERYKKQVGIMT